VIAVEAAGRCHSDLHILDGSFPAIGAWRLRASNRVQLRSIPWYTSVQPVLERPDGVRQFEECGAPGGSLNSRPKLPETYGEINMVTASRSVAVPFAVEDDANEGAERSGEHLTSRAECVTARSVHVSAREALEISLV
jgi:hypothetical protein